MGDSSLPTSCHGDNWERPEVGWQCPWPLLEEWGRCQIPKVFKPLWVGHCQHTAGKDVGCDEPHRRGL